MTDAIKCKVSVELPNGTVVRMEHELYAWEFHGDLPRAVLRVHECLVERSKIVAEFMSRDPDLAALLCCEADT